MVLIVFVGLSYLFDFDGVILFLEDIDEVFYWIDRMMSILKFMGVFDKIVGFVFGDCNDCRLGCGYGLLILDDIFVDYIKLLGIFVYCGVMIGYIKC